MGDRAIEAQKPVKIIDHNTVVFTRPHGIIGKDSACTVVVDSHPKIADYQCEFAKRPSGWYIGSGNKHLLVKISREGRDIPVPHCNPRDAQSVLLKKNDNILFESVRIVVDFA